MHPHSLPRLVVLFPPHFIFGDASAPHRITALTTAVS
eukprot:SAG25_NODE_10115_length_345_cov_1.032520_2_plen_36_part_01